MNIDVQRTYVNPEISKSDGWISDIILKCPFCNMQKQYVTSGLNNIYWRHICKDNKELDLVPLL